MKMELAGLADGLDVEGKRKGGIRNYAEISGLRIWR